METSDAAVEITDALIRSTLRDQARMMPRKLPKRGCTKPELKGKGKFAKASRQALRNAYLLRSTRARWFKGDFTEEEIAMTRQMLKMYNDMLTPEPKPSFLAKSIKKIMGVFNG